MQNSSASFSRLTDIVARLRAADGCPWDRQQDPKSLRRYLLEETHEILEAIDNDDPEHVREELGDLMYVIVLLSDIYQANGRFTMDGVLAGISEKMIRRHPHVFNRQPEENETDLKENWQAVKKLEKAEKQTRQIPLAAIPATLPALTRAQMVLRQVALHGFDWPEINQAFGKLAEETGELQEAVDAGRRQAQLDELGDVLLAVVNIGRMLGANAELALAGATERFIARFSRLERLIKDDGRTWPELDRESMLSLWEKTKETG